MRAPAIHPETGAHQFDHKVHHMGPDGRLSKVTPYQLSIVGGHHFYFADGRVYKSNNQEVPFEELPEFLKNQWGIKSKEDQQKAILREKFAQARKIEQSIKLAQEELQKLHAEAQEEAAALEKEKEQVKLAAEQEKADLEALKAKLASQGQSQPPSESSFGAALEDGPPSDDLP